MKFQVRITGGLYRGKKLDFPEVEGLRPTPDRVKETLFNWLMFDIRGLRCLDAFAGSGALGFEALSRGAREVVMLDNSPKVYKTLHKNAASFQSSAIQVIAGDACSYLEKNNNLFDLVFLDPPFASDKMKQCIHILESGASLTTGGLLYTESAEQLQLSPEHWEALKAKKAGQVFYALYRKRA